MRVLQVHNFYRQSGGEDVVVANERALLMDHGHEARLWSVSNDAIKGVWRKFRTAWQAPYRVLRPVVRDLYHHFLEQVLRTADRYFTDLTMTYGHRRF